MAVMEACSSLGHGQSQTSNGHRASGSINGSSFTHANAAATGIMTTRRKSSSSSNFRTNPTTPPKAWIYHPTTSRSNFLPPTQTTPHPLSLLNDTLELTREYRDMVDTLGRLELEYGRSMAAAIKKFETRLDSITNPLPGQRKPPPTTLHAGIRAHMVHLKTVASLHQKHPGALGGQLVEPLTNIEKKGGETVRRLGSWAKEVKGRYEESKERVEKAKGKYHTAVVTHQNALAKLHTAIAGHGVGNVSAGTGTGGGAEVDIVKLEKAVNDAERNRAEKKRAYVLVLAGEGSDGGQGNDASEGGGLEGWGEEARSFYQHLHQSLVELFEHHANEDSSHHALLSSILERGRDSYSSVSSTTDTDSFLDFYSTSLVCPSSAIDEADVSPGSSVNEHAQHPKTSTFAVETTSSSTSIPGPLLIPHRHSSSSFPSIRRGSSGVSSSSVTNKSPSPQIPLSTSLSYSNFVPPLSAKMETMELSLEKQEQKNWMVNTWLTGRNRLEELQGKNLSGGPMASKQEELASLKALCRQYLADRGLGDPDEMWERRIGLNRELGPDLRKLATARAEMSLIESYLGQHPGPETRHELHERPFPTPSACGVCSQSIWSPFANEFACAMCNLTVHSRCALYADPECSGLKSRRRPSGGLRRGLRTGSKLLRRSSSLFVDAPHGAPKEGMPALVPEIDRRDEPLRDDELHVSPYIPAQEIDRIAIEQALTYPTDVAARGEVVRDGGVVLARVAHTYVAAGEFELSVAKGEVVRVIEPDLDGLGWVKVRRGLENGTEGLVPQSYVGFVGTSTPPLDGGSGRFVQTLYDFPPPEHTLGKGEVPISQYAIYELSDSGMSFAQNWCELVVPDGSGARLRGFVPKTYVSVI